MDLLTQKLTFCLENNLLISLINQLNKDFNQSHVHLTLLPNASSNDIAYEIIDKVTHILISNEIDIRSLLYRIDVSEKKIKELHEFTAVDIAALIVEREIEKIILRKRFSEGLQNPYN